MMKLATVIRITNWRIFAAVALISASAVFAGPVGIAPDRILVKPKAGVAQNVLDQINAVHGAREIDRIPQIGVRVLNLPAAARARVLTALKNNPNFEFAEPDFILAPDAVANDPYFTSQWHLSKIGATAAWDKTTGSSSITIAILDTGVEASHPDLASKLLSGWNFYDNNSNTSDSHGHGTAVAGTAAALANNAAGVASVAWNCRVLPIRISDPNGYAYESTIAKALSWAADRGARVANISFRASGSSTVTSSAQYFQNKGGVVVISSGNEGLVDSASDNPYVLTISASDSNDAITSWSNTGNNVDLAAPGESVLTTMAGGSYGYWSGTSFSAPVVAGAAALVLSANPSLSGAQVQQILKQSADDLGIAGWDSKYGHGRVNVQRAVDLALGSSGSTPAPAPTADTTAPNITLTSPAQGAWVRRNVTVQVNATDNVAVTKVVLYVDGKATATSTTAPFSINWSSQKSLIGYHNLQCVAYDAAGNSKASQIVMVYRY